jgi:hypothetical protein
MTTIQNPREVAAAQAAQARGAAQDAAQQARDAAQIAGGGTGVVTITKDGVTTVLTDASPEAIATALGMPDPRDRGDGDGPYVVGSLAIVSTAIVFIVGMILYHRRNSRGGGATAALPKDMTDRLTRMEAGIDTMAVEIERISEGQRFTTRLLSDRPLEEVRRG